MIISMNLNPVRKLITDENGGIRYIKKNFQSPQTLAGPYEPTAQPDAFLATATTIEAVVAMEGRHISLSGELTVRQRTTLGPRVRPKTTQPNQTLLAMVRHGQYYYLSSSGRGFQLKSHNNYYYQ